ncbi:hypothetical protein C8J56DRAFT_1044056 [Mycena floridula]|nr:hypothetical protein C8J56DRAFT_1044056 [Mycena floridula]
MPLSLTARTTYKKVAGSLELTDSHLQWTQDGSKVPSVKVPYADYNSLFCSKEGASQVRLKLGIVGDDTGYQFTFTAPQPVAYNEREKFKNQITSIIGRNRLGPAANGPVTAFASTTTTPKLQPQPTPSRASSSRAASVSSDQRGTPIILGNDPAKDFRLRKTVLLAHPELAALHRELVFKGEISEQEFWEGREHLLLAQSASESQRKGKSGQLVDPRPETIEGGETKIRITPQLVHDIFDEYPVVAKAYSDNVPNKLSEAEFWKRYFQSKLFNAHRASIRSSAAQHVVKDDPILDKYLEKDDDGLEPRRERPGEVGLSVDLAATLEDHGETGNEKDVTMQAGKQRGALPLIRKFNEHSERLLNSALGEGPAAKRQKTGLEDRYAEIDLDDLRDSEASAGIILEMQNKQQYFESRMGNVSADGSSQNKLDIKTLIREAQVGLEQWDKRLAQMTIERGPADAALSSMTKNVAARLDVKSKQNDIPEDFFRDMTSCHTAASEFLRQFWSATYPPILDTQNLAVSTPAQRATKAAKMIGYLSKTQEKVDALLQAASQRGLDPTKIETAMQPVLNAVDRALTFHRNKKGSRA